MDIVLPFLQNISILLSNQPDMVSNQQGPHRIVHQKEYCWVLLTFTVYLELKYSKTFLSKKKVFEDVTAETLVSVNCLWFIKNQA